MDPAIASLPPGDPKLINTIVNHLKSQGLFDQFRRDCLADVDTKPAYQNLRHRVETYVGNFLSKQEWKADLNKNQLRDNLRRHINDSGMLAIGVDRIVEQVVNPKVYRIFVPQIESVVFQLLGREPPPSQMATGSHSSVKEEPSPQYEVLGPKRNSNEMCDLKVPATPPVEKNPENCSADVSTSEKIEKEAENVSEKPTTIEEPEAEEASTADEPLRNTVETQTETSSFVEDKTEKNVSDGEKSLSPSVENKTPLTADNGSSEEAEEKPKEEEKKIIAEENIKKELVESDAQDNAKEIVAAPSDLKEKPNVEIPKKATLDGQKNRGGETAKRSDAKAEKVKTGTIEKGKPNAGDKIKTEPDHNKKAQSESKVKRHDSGNKAKSEQKHASVQPEKGSKSHEVKPGGSESSKHRSSSGDRAKTNLAHKHGETCKTPENKIKSSEHKSKTPDDSSRSSKSSSPAGSKIKHRLYHSSDKGVASDGKTKTSEKPKACDSGKADKKTEKAKPSDGVKKDDEKTKLNSKNKNEAHSKVNKNDGKQNSEKAKEKIKTEVSKAVSNVVQKPKAQDGQIKSPKDKMKDGDGHGRHQDKEKNLKKESGDKVSKEKTHSNVKHATEKGDAAKTKDKQRKLSESKHSPEKQTDEKRKSDEKQKVHSEKPNDKPKQEIKTKQAEPVVKEKEPSGGAVRRDSVSQKTKTVDNADKDKSEKPEKKETKPKTAESGDRQKNSDKHKFRKDKSVERLGKGENKDEGKAKPLEGKESMNKAKEKSKLSHKSKEGSDSSKGSSTPSSKTNTPEKWPHHSKRKRKHSEQEDNEPKKRHKSEKETDDQSNEDEPDLPKTPPSKTSMAFDTEDMGMKGGEDDRASVGGWSDVTVSSVHTSDLSDYDDRISLTNSSDEENLTSTGEKTGKKKRGRGNKERKSPSKTGSKEKTRRAHKYWKYEIAPFVGKSQFFEDVKEVAAQEEANKQGYSENEPRRELRRQRKINPRYSSDEFASIFSKGKDKLHYSEFDEQQPEEKMEKPRHTAAKETRHVPVQEERKEEFVKTGGRGRKSTASVSSVDQELDLPYSPRSDASESDSTSLKKAKDRDSSGRPPSPKSDISHDSSHTHGPRTPDSLASSEGKRRTPSCQHYDSSDLYKPRPAIRGGRRSRVSERYEDSDLYKPRPVITASSRRSRAATPPLASETPVSTRRSQKTFAADVSGGGSDNKETANVQESNFEKEEANEHSDNDKEDSEKSEEEGGGGGSEPEIEERKERPVTRKRRRLSSEKEDDSINACTWRSLNSPKYKKERNQNRRCSSTEKSATTRAKASKETPSTPVGRRRK